MPRKIIQVDIFVSFRVFNMFLRYANISKINYMNTNLPNVKTNYRLNIKFFNPAFETFTEEEKNVCHFL